MRLDTVNFPRPNFPHRKNPDGTFDSFCAICFATIATEGSEEDLKKAEAAHECPGLDFGQILHQKVKQRQ